LPANPNPFVYERVTDPTPVLVKVVGQKRK
jgi:hypothetical protein